MSDDEAAVLALLEEHDAASLAGDGARIRGLFSSRPDTLLVGSARGERAESGDLDEFFAHEPPAEWRWNERRVRVLGDVAWLYAEGKGGTVPFGSGLVLDYRFTAVLRREPEGWRIVHFHGAEPALPLAER